MQHSFEEEEQCPTSTEGAGAAASVRVASICDPDSAAQTDINLRSPRESPPFSLVGIAFVLTTLMSDQA